MTGAQSYTQLLFVAGFTVRLLLLIVFFCLFVIEELEQSFPTLFPPFFQLEIQKMNLVSPLGSRAYILL